MSQQLNPRPMAVVDYPRHPQYLVISLDAYDIGWSSEPY